METINNWINGPFNNLRLNGLKNWITPAETFHSRWVEAQVKPDSRRLPPRHWLRKAREWNRERQRGRQVPVVVGNNWFLRDQCAAKCILGSAFQRSCLHLAADNSLQIMEPGRQISSHWISIDPISSLHPNAIFDFASPDVLIYLWTQETTLINPLHLFQEMEAARNTSCNHPCHAQLAIALSLNDCGYYKYGSP